MYQDKRTVYGIWQIRPSVNFRGARVINTALEIARGPCTKLTRERRRGRHTLNKGWQRLSRVVDSSKMGTKMLLPQQCLLHVFFSHNSSPRARPNSIPRSFQRRKEVPRRPRQPAPVASVKISKSGSSIKTSADQEMFNQNAAAQNRLIKNVITEEKLIHYRHDEKMALRELNLKVLREIHLRITSSNLPLSPKMYAGPVAAQPPSPKDLPQPRFVRGSSHGRTKMAALSTQL